MARSLQEQLLKAGLAIESSLENAQDNAKNKSAKQKQPPKNNAKSDPKNTAKSSRKPRHAQSRTKEQPQQAPKAIKKPKAAKSNEPSLANMYRQRAEFERKEQEAEEARKREQARLKKQNRKKLRELVLKHLKNDENANLRYNFVVGSNVKYVFVTEEQQNQLAAGELAITFIDGKRCLIPTDLHDQIKALEPTKIIVIADPNDAQNNDDIPIDLEQPSLAEKETLAKTKKVKQDDTKNKINDQSNDKGINKNTNKNEQNDKNNDEIK